MKTEPAHAERQRRFLHTLPPRGNVIRKDGFFQAELLFELCVQNDIYVRVENIPGRLNVPSRQLFHGYKVISTEWMLHPSVLLVILKRWETPNIDLFATRFNNQNSDEIAVDTLSLFWKGLSAYLFPQMALFQFRFDENFGGGEMVIPHFPNLHGCPNF